MVACPHTGSYWCVTSAPLCADPAHDHRSFDLHIHRSVIVLPDGTEITPVSFDPEQPYARDEPPNFGLYLDPRWQPPWAHDHVRWPDFGTPDDVASVEDSLRSLLSRARAGQRVELGCLGGHGRTGTALACMVAMTGRDPTQAVAWVRENYCERAVETPEQEAFVATLIAPPSGAR
jgi:hypothetical protein